MAVAGKSGKLYSASQIFHLLKAPRYLVMVELALDRRTVDSSALARSCNLWSETSDLMSIHL